jgi:fructose-1,6-bisphosphatase/inositol monophosphatase family enzyme
VNVTLTELERHALDRYRGGGPLESGSPLDSDRWVVASLMMALRASQKVRESGLEARQALIKEDGSPYTRLEQAIEDGVRADLGAFAPEASMIGEETGGEGVGPGFAVALDPVDGTWAFLTETGTYAVTLSVFKDGVPYLGVIANPDSGEVAYARAAGGTRLLRLGLFGQGDAAFDLPRVRPPSKKLLVNLHPSRSGRQALLALHGAWADGEAAMIRSPGGSPAWFLLEAARGHYVYVNLWSEEPAAPWDLAAGCLTVRGAGGEVVGLDGRPVQPVGHRGAFVAGVDPARVDQVLAILARSVP